MTITPPLYTPDKIKQLIKQGEGEHVEFKALIPEPTRLAQLIASFANSSGGVILVGVEEPGEIIGTDLDKLWSALTAALKHLDPAPEVKPEIVVVDRKIVGVIVVPKSEKGVVLSSSGAFIRKDDKVVPLPAAQLQALLAGNNLPAELKRLANTIEQQSSLIGNQTETIDKLREQLVEAGRFRNKLPDWIISGIIGTVLGVIGTLIFGG